MNKTEKLPTTKTMVIEALISLHAKKGTTLVAVKKFISETYGVNITTARKHLITNYLHALINSEDLKIKTGRGLTGHFVLTDKKKFAAKFETGPRKNKRTGSKKITIKITPPISKKKPAKQNSEFDTPGFSGQLVGSTPVNVAPNAPIVRARKRNAKPLSQEDTPRSSIAED
uniref:H15 domain-containing protein n=1 Tax=Glossina brevipalpis TaxID=37001 RepID=A0A1A9X2J8_9MUSC